MKAVFFKFAGGISRWIGTWFLSLFARVVAAGYFLFLPGRVRESARFYRALFPEKGRVSVYASVWKQYQRFTRIYIDRMLLRQDLKDVNVSVEGWEALKQLLEKKEGAILLMSHLGNWDMAAHLLRKKLPNIKLLLYMGIREGEQLEKIQKEDLVDQGVKVIAVDQNSASPFQIIEANTFLNEGGVVSLTGDRIWHESQRSVTVNFLDHEVLLPESPHLLAMLSGKPLFALFPVKTGDNSFHIRFSPPIHVKATTRKERKTAVTASAQTYADLLAEEAHRHPYEWFHFEPFLGKKL